MNHRYASEREATAAAKRLRPEQQHEWSSVSVFRKVWKLSLIHISTIIDELLR